MLDTILTLYQFKIIEKLNMSAFCPVEVNVYTVVGSGVTCNTCANITTEGLNGCTI